MRRLKVLGIALTLSLVLAACSAANSGTTAPPSTNATGIGGSVTLSNEIGGTWSCGFNPFGSNAGQSVGFIYEPLEFVNSLQNDKTTPWLATGSSWSNDAKTLTFTIRKGVKWSDGAAFGANDVLFTFNELKKYPALDVNSIWSVLKSVSLQNGDQIVLQFNSPATTDFYFVADQLSIIPEHIWSKISNPVTANDAKPVGTGPYLMSSCTAENIVYKRNPGYWQHGLPKVETVTYPAFSTNTTANEDLQQGIAQWGGQYIPNIKGYYLTHNSDYHDWFPPLTNVDLFPNLTDKLLSLPVREAISLGINRAEVSKLGETGYEPPANQDGIVTPTFSAWNNSSYSNMYPYDPSKAEQILEKAGFHKVNGVFQNASGQALSFTVLNVGDYSDWVDDLTVIRDELAEVGIQIKVENLASGTYDTDQYDGTFQLIYDGETGGPTPYYELRQFLYGPGSAPIGKTAQTNWERFDTSTFGSTSTAVDSLINQYSSETTLAGQESIVDQLEKVMVDDVPVIPVVEGVDWYEYDTANLSGWPTPSDPYAQPSPYSTPDLEVVLLRLRWTK
jgi:peptide/nickel transport system substrate-binding protein